MMFLPKMQRMIGFGVTRAVFIAFLGVLCVLDTGLAEKVHAQARDGGEFEGAVWRFVITSKVKGGGTLRGQFRVKDDVLYQRATEEDTEYSKVVGQNHPLGKGKTRMDFSDFRARDKKGNFRNGLKGTARLTIIRYGSWSGDFTDGGGGHWNFKCERIKE